MKMNDQEIVQWLMENGGSVIRYRVATELTKDMGQHNHGKLIAELLDSKPVKLWLSRCQPIATPKHYKYAYYFIHGSKDMFFENFVPKLVQLGLRAGIPVFDEATATYRERLDEDVDKQYEDPFTLFYLTILATFLAMAGYEKEGAVRTVLNSRLEALYEFTSQRNYDIYVDPSNYPSIPKHYRVNIVNPKLYQDNVIVLPWIYDVYGFAAIYRKSDAITKEKIDKIIQYILTPEYQRFPDGYGSIVFSKNRALAMGWSVHVPGFFGFQETRSDFIWKSLIQRVALMASFPYARKHLWFKESMEYLDQFKTGRGTYILPKHFLTEGKSGYWVSGQRMGLGENRRNKLWHELESTFWVLKVKSLVGLD